MPLRLKQRQQPIDELALQSHQLIDGGGINPPAGISVASQGAEPRAGRIHQDAIKAGLQFGLLLRQGRGITVLHRNALQPEPFGIAAHPPQAGLTTIESQHQALITHQLRQVGALATWSRAGIEDALARLRIEKGSNALSSAILNTPMPLGKAW